MNFWDQRFSEQGYAYGTEANDFLKQVASKFLPPKAKVLSLGEGEGRNAVYLAKLGYEVTALDSSKVGLEKASQFARENNVHIQTICADLEDYKIQENAWDGIVSIWCHLPSGLRMRVHSDCVRGLKKSGAFIVEGYTPEQLKYDSGGPKDIGMLYTSKQMQAELSGLKLEICQEVERMIDEGKYHQGKSATLQLVGIKL